MPIRQTQGHFTNNVEIAALMAPKPMLLVSDGQDWTQETPVVEYPFIQRIYGFYNKVDSVQNAHFTNEGHDFGSSKRNAIYRFFASQLGLNLSRVSWPNGTVDEIPNVIQDPDAMHAFTSVYPRPVTTLHGEAQVLQAFTTAQHGAVHIVPGFSRYLPVALLIVMLEIAITCLWIVQRRKIEKRCVSSLMNS
jgi:uncharacterized protein